VRDRDRVEGRKPVRRKRGKDDAVGDRRRRARARVEEDARPSALDEIRRAVSDREHGDAHGDVAGPDGAVARGGGRRDPTRACAKHAEKSGRPRERQRGAGPPSRCRSRRPAPGDGRERRRHGHEERRRTARGRQPRRGCRHADEHAECPSPRRRHVAERERRRRSERGERERDVSDEKEERRDRHRDDRKRNRAERHEPEVPRGDRCRGEPDRDRVDDEPAHRAPDGVADGRRRHDLRPVPALGQCGRQEAKREDGGERELKARAQRLRRGQSHDRRGGEGEERVAAPPAGQDVAEPDREGDECGAQDRCLRLDDERVRADHKRHGDAAEDAPAQDRLGHAPRRAGEDREVEAGDGHEMREPRMREVAADLVAFARTAPEEHHPDERGGVRIEVAGECGRQARIEPRAYLGHGERTRRGIGASLSYDQARRCAHRGDGRRVVHMARRHLESAHVRRRRGRRTARRKPAGHDDGGTRDRRDPRVDAVAVD
jgi:hypothetical protein